jgi:hypothetical protein
LKLQQRGVWTFERGLVLVALVAAVAPACAERIGKNAAAGAVTELQRQRAAADQDPNKQMARVAGQRGVEGAVAALDAPEQREAIQRLISQTVAVATATAVQEATRHMIDALGPDGQGPLAVSLARTSERISAAGTDGIGDELAGLMPECTGPDRTDCIERRLQATARSTAASFTSGVKDTIGWQLLLLMFMLGAGGGVLGAWLWSLRPVRRRDFRTA